MKSKSEKTSFVQPRNPNGILESPQVPAIPVASDAPVAPSGVESSPPFSKPKRARNGKVARLPKQMRDQINQMLDDNLHYHSIIKSLGDQGKDLEADHIRRWKSGGYRDYLREQRLIEQCRERRERVFNHLSGDDNITSFQATQQIATAQICETIVGLGGEILREALLANPLNYFRMLNSFARLTTGGLKCERHLADEAQRIALLKKKATDPKKGISPSSLHQMEEKLNLM